jgi:hypothetical protein
MDGRRAGRVRSGSGDDPFAVRTMTSGGEEIAFAADPYVSDAQRGRAARG